MPDFSVFFPLFAVLIGAVVVIAVIWLTTKLMWKVAEPNEALIISGLTRGTLETQGRTRLQDRHRHRHGRDSRTADRPDPETLPQRDRARRHLRHHPGHPGDRPRGGHLQDRRHPAVHRQRRAAIPRSAGPKMDGQVYNVFEGHLRSIIGSLTIEEMIRERDKLGLTRSAAPAAPKWKSSDWWSIRLQIKDLAGSDGLHHQPRQTAHRRGEEGRAHRRGDQQP